MTRLILASYPGKGWRVAATGKVDKPEHEDLWALNLDMGNWNNETWHDLKNYYADWGVCYLPRLNNLLQWQNQNITAEIFSLTSTLYSSNSSCHQPSSHSFAILAMFFSLCKPRRLLFHFLQLYQNSRANTTLSPELFHYIGFFWWYPALLTSLYWISQTSLKFDQWLAEYEELARKFVPSELEKYFE